MDERKRRDPGALLDEAERVDLYRLIERRLRQGLAQDTVAERIGVHIANVERVAALLKKGKTFMTIRVDVRAIEDLRTMIKAKVRSGMQSHQAEDAKVDLLRQVERLEEKDPAKAKEKD